MIAEFAPIRRLSGGPLNWPIDVNLMPREDFLRIFGVRQSTVEERLADLEQRVERIAAFLVLG